MILINFATYHSMCVVCVAAQLQSLLPEVIHLAAGVREPQRSGTQPNFLPFR